MCFNPLLTAAQQPPVTPVTLTAGRENRRVGSFHPGTRVLSVLLNAL